MKKVFYITMVLIISGVLPSCKKFLDLNPMTEIGEDVALNSKDRIQRALNGAYSRLQVNEYYGFEWSNAAWLSDDNVTAYSAGTTDLQFDGNAVLSSSNTIEITWRAMYQAINAANNVIAAAAEVSDPAMTQQDRDNLAGQAQFIRALVYFDMVRTWGGVPVITTPTRGLNETSFAKRNTAAEVYTQVLKDLAEAEAKLGDAINRNVATKRAAQALQARVYLYQKDWAKAEQFASTLINDVTNFSLVKPFEKIITDKNTAEAIFELDYTPTDGNGLAGIFYPVSLGGGYRVGPTNEIITILQTAAKAGSRSVLLGNTGTQTYGNRYRRAGGGKMDDNYAVLRLAEMYLIRAEARANQDKVVEGLADLNVVRSRADLVPLTGLTKAGLLQAIEDERRIEFAFEPFRWFDLVRTGRARDVLRITDERKFLFPLPTSEILANKNLEQNAGY